MLPCLGLVCPYYQTSMGPYQGADGAAQAEATAPGQSPLSHRRAQEGRQPQRQGCQGIRMFTVYICTELLASVSRACNCVCTNACICICISRRNACIWVRAVSALALESSESCSMRLVLKAPVFGSSCVEGLKPLGCGTQLPRPLISSSCWPLSDSCWSLLCSPLFCGKSASICICVCNCTYTYTCICI